MLGPCTQIFPAVLLGGAGTSRPDPTSLAAKASSTTTTSSPDGSRRPAPVHFRLQRLYSTLNAVGTWPASMKVAFDMLGKRGGYPRAPILPLGPADREKVRQALIDTGLLSASGATLRPGHGGRPVTVTCRNLSGARASRPLPGRRGKHRIATLPGRLAAVRRSG